MDNAAEKRNRFGRLRRTKHAYLDGSDIQIIHQLSKISVMILPSTPHAFDALGGLHRQAVMQVTHSTHAGRWS